MAPGATKTQRELSTWIKKIESKARERKSAQDDLEYGDTLSASERNRLQSVLRTCNKEIAKLAESVNKAFRKAAADKARIDPVRVSTEPISDPKIQSWLLSVKDGIDKHNKHLEGDSPELGLKKKVLDRQLGDAQRMEASTKKLLQELGREAERIKKQVAETNKQLEQAEIYRAKLDARRKQVKRDEQKVEPQIKKIDSMLANKGREKTQINTQIRQAEGTYRRETKPEIKRREKAKVRGLKSRLEDIERYEREHLQFRRKELANVEEHLEQELRKFTESHKNNATDIKQIRDERGKLEDLHRECVERIKKQQVRLEEIQRTKAQLADAIAAQPY
ncbi:hypothetical protein ACFL59_03345 [Planctomycetota bacterium]